MKKLSLVWQILIGMVLGIAVGYLFMSLGWGGVVTDWIAPLGTIFINLLKMIAIPLVLLSLVMAVGNMENIKKLSNMGGKTIVIFLITTVLSCVIGLGLVYSIKPGKMMSEEAASAFREQYGITHLSSDKPAVEVPVVDEITPVAPAVDQEPVAPAVDQATVVPGEPAAVTEETTALAETVVKAEETAGPQPAMAENLKKGVADVKEKSVMQFIVEIFPDNMARSMTDNSQMLQVIVIAIFIGVAIVMLDRKYTNSVMDVIGGLNEIILKVIQFIMAFAPIGVFGLMAQLIVSVGGNADVFAALGMYIVTVVTALAVIAWVFNPILIKMFTKLNPVKFIAKMLRVQVVAFSTSSSAATLPVTMDVAENELGISQEIAGFVLPVGVTINMNGTVCYQSVAIVFIAQFMGIDLSFADIIKLITIATVTAIGTPGIPGGSIVMVMMALETVHIPSEALLIILGVDRPIDMIRSAVNVSGDVVTACMVQEGENRSAAKS